MPTPKQKKKSPCVLDWVCEGDKRLICRKCKKYFVLVNGKLKEV